MTPSHLEGFSVQEVAAIKSQVKADIEGYSKALVDASKVVLEQIAACTTDGCTADELAAFETIKDENEAEVAKASAVLSAMSSTSSNTPSDSGNSGNSGNQTCSGADCAAASVAHRVTVAVASALALAVLALVH